MNIFDGMKKLWCHRAIRSGNMISWIVWIVSAMEMWVERIKMSTNNLKISYRERGFRNLSNRIEVIYKENTDPNLSPLNMHKQKKALQELQIYLFTSSTICSSSSELQSNCAIKSLKLLWVWINENLFCFSISTITANLSTVQLMYKNICQTRPNTIKQQR
jgi:hypothetical protein